MVILDDLSDVLIIKPFIIYNNIKLIHKHIFSKPSWILRQAPAILAKLRTLCE